MTMPGHLAIAVHLLVVYGVLTAVCLLTTTSAEFDHHPRTNSKMLADVESRLLHMLGLSARPRPSDKPHIPEYMLQLYRTKLNRKRIANTVRSYFHQESEIGVRHASNKYRFYFNVTSLPASDVLKEAELRVYRESVTPSCEPCVPRQDNAFSAVNVSTTTTRRERVRRASAGVGGGDDRLLQRILVYDVLRPSTSTDNAIVRLIDSRQVDVRHSSWESFDVFPAVVRWQQEPLANYGLYVRVQHACNTGDNSGVRLRRSVVTQSSDARDNERTWQEQRPLLVVHSDDPKASSKKKSPSSSSRQWRRSASDGRKGQRRKAARDSCRRHQLYVDFSDVGWNDWIVAPPGYQAYYCHGECNFPLADHLNSTNHAIVQTLMHSVKPHAVPRVCCVPTQLSSISMLYLDEYDKVVLKNYQDMVVQGCGCR